MLEKMPAGKVARVLNDEKIPSPDAGRYRTDNGIRHRVSGLWNHNTITGIGRNSLLAAVASYGRRSMGDRRRHSAEGPRELEEHRDLRADGKLKVVRNKDADVVKATARFDPVLEPERFAALQQELDRRGGTQRGRTRSVDQSRNPLGGRIFDMNCGALMYRVPVEDSFKYRCSLYMQSHGHGRRYGISISPSTRPFNPNGSSAAEREIPSGSR